MDYVASAYDGGIEAAKMHTEPPEQGTYTYPDGVTKYVGEFRNGAFHGKGDLVFDQGVYHGQWANGRAVSGTYEFADGLEYAREDWAYCTPEDRRFWSEQQAGDIGAAGELKRTDKTPRAIPAGTYDVGDGYFDAAADKVLAYGGSGDVVRDPTQAEKKWIVEKTRLSSARPAE